MEIITETELLKRIREFLARHEMAPTTFGRNATGNANLVKELEEGKSPSLRTVQRIADYMTEKDSDATLRAKLHAPFEPVAEPDEADNQLPFGQAPVNPTGASLPISSSTTERPPLRSGSANSRCSDSGEVAR